MEPLIWDAYVNVELIDVWLAFRKYRDVAKNRADEASLHPLSSPQQFTKKDTTTAPAGAASSTFFICLKSVWERLFCKHTKFLSSFEKIQ